jgi:elongation factor 1-beta
LLLSPPVLLLKRKTRWTIFSVMKTLMKKPLLKPETTPPCLEVKLSKKKAAAEAAGKVAPEAKSLILWEVKPVDDETDLDALAKRILAITNEKGGLHWKTEYKKAPIAFGIFKLIIGATIHDNLVSTDDVQEQIEEMEDMVQSVDIQSFNKL